MPSTAKSPMADCFRYCPSWSPLGPFGQTAYALWLPQTHLPPKIRVFVDFLAERLRETPAAEVSH
jgi:DNA-binding transcriptional LysR family regulator